MGVKELTRILETYGRVCFYIHQHGDDRVECFVTGDGVTWSATGSNKVTALNRLYYKIQSAMETIQ
jgi:hypothetical protein